MSNYLDEKLDPIVLGFPVEKVFLRYLFTMHVFPTFASPSMTTLNDVVSPSG